VFQTRQIGRRKPPESSQSPLESVRVYTLKDRQGGSIFLGSEDGMIAVGVTDLAFGCLENARKQVVALGGYAEIQDVAPLEFIDIVIGRNDIDLLILNDRDIPLSARMHRSRHPHTKVSEQDVRQAGLYAMVSWIIMSHPDPSKPWGPVQDQLDQGESVRISTGPPRTEKFLAEISLPSGDLGLEHVAPLLVQDDSGRVRWLYVDPIVVSQIMLHLGTHESGLFWAQENDDATRIYIDTSAVVALPKGEGEYVAVE